MPNQWWILLVINLTLMAVFRLIAWRRGWWKPRLKGAPRQSSLGRFYLDESIKFEPVDDPQPGGPPPDVPR